MVFDGAGRRLQIQQNLRTGGSGSNPIVDTVLTQFGFGANGNQIRLVDSNSGTTIWAFDTLDRKISETYQDGSSREFVYRNPGHYSDRLVGERFLLGTHTPVACPDLLPRPAGSGEKNHLN